MLIFLVMLSGCAKESYSYNNLPEFPKAGTEVARELEEICDDVKCKNTNDWLNRLYRFYIEYNTILAGI